MNMFNVYKTFIKKACLTSLSLTFIALIGFTSSASAGALCGGGWVMVGGVSCDFLPIGGGSATCIFFGTDVDANGAIQGNTSDVCVLLDSNDKYHDFSCAEACKIDCSKQYCMTTTSTGSNDFTSEARAQGRLNMNKKE